MNRDIPYEPTSQDVLSMHSLLLTLRNPSHPSHQNAITTLNAHVTSANFILTLIYVIAYDTQGASDVRQLAGFILKNYVFVNLKILDDQVVNVIKQGEIFYRMKSTSH